MVPELSLRGVEKRRTIFSSRPLPFFPFLRRFLALCTFILDTYSSQAQGPCLRVFFFPFFKKVLLCRLDLDLGEGVRLIDFVCIRLCGS